MSVAPNAFAPYQIQGPDDLIWFEHGRILGVRELRVAAVIFSGSDPELLQGSYWEDSSGSWSLLGLTIRFGLCEIAAELARRKACPCIIGTLDLHDSRGFFAVSERYWYDEIREDSWRPMNFSFWRRRPSSDIFERMAYFKDDDSEAGPDDKHDDSEAEPVDDGCVQSPWKGIEICQQTLTTWPHGGQESLCFSASELISVSTYCRGWTRENTNQALEEAELECMKLREMTRCPAILTILSLCESGQSDCLHECLGLSSPASWVWLLQQAIFLGKSIVVKKILPLCGDSRPSILWQACDFIDICFENLLITRKGKSPVNFRVPYVTLLMPEVVESAVYAGFDLSGLVIERKLQLYARRVDFFQPVQPVLWRCGLLDAAILAEEKAAAHALHDVGVYPVLLTSNGAPFLKSNEDGDQLFLNISSMKLAVTCGVDLKLLRIDLSLVSAMSQESRALTWSDLSTNSLSLLDFSILLGDHTAVSFLLSHGMDVSHLTTNDLSCQFFLGRSKVSILKPQLARWLTLLWGHWLSQAKCFTEIQRWAKKCAMKTKAKQHALSPGVLVLVYMYATELAAIPHDLSEILARLASRLGNVAALRDGSCQFSCQMETVVATAVSNSSQDVADGSVTITDQESVIQIVDHPDAPAQIDAEVAAIESDLVWADNAERTLQDASSSCTTLERRGSSYDNFTGGQRTEEAFGLEEKIFLLRFGSASAGGDGPSECRQKLLQGPQLAPYRQSLEKAGWSCELPEQALIFVEPDQHEIVRKSLVGITLHPYHVIVSESLKYLIHEVLSELSRRKRPKLKPPPHGRYEIILGSPEQMESKPFSDALDESMALGIICEERTFLCCSRLLRNARSVVQSSTEVLVETSRTHYSSSRGLNPRR